MWPLCLFGRIENLFWTWCGFSNGKLRFYFWPSFWRSGACSDWIKNDQQQSHTLYFSPLLRTCDMQRSPALSFHCSLFNSYTNTYFRICNFTFYGWFYRIAVDASKTCKPAQNAGTWHIRSHRNTKNSGTLKSKYLLSLSRLLPYFVVVGLCCCCFGCCCSISVSSFKIMKRTQYGPVQMNYGFW